MQLAELVVEGLFGKYDHKVSFPTTAEEDTKPSVVILHGPNGIGKTTMLRMLNGIMDLDFTTFRSVPFANAYLAFNTGARLSVKRRDEGELLVQFNGAETLLHPQHSGPWREEDAESVKELRLEFKRETESLTLEYVSASRTPPDPAVDDDSLRRRMLIDPGGVVRTEDYRTWMTLNAAKESKAENNLAKSVSRFITEAQIDSPAYFRPSEPDVFLRIIEDLASPAKPLMGVNEIVASLNSAHELDVGHARLGLGRDRWDYDRLMALLRDGPELDERSLAVLGTYAEFLDSRARAREPIAERLRTFETVMGEFFTDKEVRVSVKNGFTVSHTNGERLDENLLSSGEYQLLYLMVAALTTRRRGTVIAIDEPELSMHIAWQRMLVPSLIKCASRAAPQLLLATHSPDIAAGYPESLIELGRTN